MNTSAGVLNPSVARGLAVYLVRHCIQVANVAGDIGAFREVLGRVHSKVRDRQSRF